MSFTTYRSRTLGLGMVDCGEKMGYQVQNMSSLSTTITLLNPTTDPETSPDPALAALAQQVNQFFEPKAKLALQQFRGQLAAQGKMDIAQRTEITVLLTDKGLQLGWSYALPRKEIAPAPTKSFFRRILGPFYPGRKFWVMPQTDAQAPGKTYTVWWPWLFWALVLLGALAVTWVGIGHPGYSGSLKLM